MAAYDTTGWDPPAPIVRATVRGPSQVAIAVPMLIDTGSDITVVPRSVAEAVGAALHPSRISVQFYSGAEETWDEAHLTVGLARFRFEGLFLVAESSYGILGRNVLNLVLLTLDGPRLRWSIGAAGQV